MISLIALTHLQESSGDWVGSVSGRGGNSRLVSGCPARFTTYDPFGVLGPLGFRGARRSSALPPPPFLVQPYFSGYPPNQRESIFVVVPLALSLSVPPGLGPVNLLNAVRAPFHIPPPPSFAMLVVLRTHP